MGLFKAIGGGILISIVLGIVCSFIIALLYYLSIISIFTSMAAEKSTTWPNILFGLTFITTLVSIVFIPYYSFGYSYDVGVEDGIAKCKE